MPAKEVLVAGYFGAGNVGDELLLGQFTRWAQEQGARVTALSVDPEHTRRTHGIAAVPRGDLLQVAEAMMRSDLVALGGGGLFQDYYSFRVPELFRYPGGISYYAQVVLMARQLRRPSLLWAMGVGPLRTAQAQAITREVVRLADAVSVRDEASAALLRSIGVEREVLVAPDPVWVDGGQVDAEAPEKLPALRGRRILALALREWPFVSDWDQRLARALKSRFSEIRAAAQQRASGKPVVVTAHSFVTGARRAGDERPVIGQLGNVAQLEGSAVGEGVAYVALGHLHQPQAIAGHEHWRYCGSLLPMGFDEVATPRQVVIADLPEDGAPARVREVPLVPFRRYARVRGKPSEIEAAIALLHEGQRGEPTPWLEAVAELDGPNPAIARDVQAWAQARGWAALAIRSSHADAATARQWEEKAALAELDPVEVFRRLWTTTYPEQEPQPELIAAYEGLLARVRAEG